MNKKQEDYKVLQAIFKNADSKKRSCLLCGEQAINSHLLQKNGILNLIAEDNHLFQIQPNDFFTADKKGGIIEIKLVGINSSMSYNLFCNAHDTAVFKAIESEVIDFFSYKTQLLFSYRALCAEMRKKIINIDCYERILKAKTFEFNYGFLKSVEFHLNAHRQGVRQIDFYLTAFVNSFTSEEECFHFETIDLEFIPICVSAAFSPIDEVKHNWKFLNNPEKVLDYLFINIVPNGGKLKLIIGYHKALVDGWMMDYIESWKNVSGNTLTKKLTDLITTKIETWAVRPSFFRKIDPKALTQFKDYWNDNAENLLRDQSIDFDLFENCI